MSNDGKRKRWKFFQIFDAWYRLVEISIAILLRPRSGFLDAMASDRSYKYVIAR